ncbi:SMR family transporter [Clostridium luticellarii]|jgi:multidrug transporter EmrE-like cation transporter|uniref:Putative 4-amino-4-deoxy-L-arabinose-phosphoundecaprenol flippase subunit ArnF n=1 Tax=Clostridium luticellarii TaxID=1691940 RepID=A0A2T0BGU1_9CLOT|nr:SMR family transporter [Clostridium luticellarii]MCI1943939.1 SMR family transporter [Clostridium luticellarii]MCI1967200.1 SMR family transporter [Clostridium luticellarii]MCI1995931.1 SMR family transporter [Clostridium luticellarii]MCI2038480.1 SMR family transporter [Clostridium luticellarii]PRR83099.1 putative 4-amino-4-deoxy-L-arabinose-phosphoundecaprenol flippase subunit ArnF [Clostridium luticellarii]
MISLILASVFLGAMGQVLVKYGAVNLQLDFTLKYLLPSILSILKNIPVMCGIISYGLSFLLWIKVLSKVELSYAYPMVSLGYIITMLFSYFVFKENITLMRILGVGFIIIGVILVSRS